MKVAIGAALAAGLLATVSAAGCGHKSAKRQDAPPPADGPSRDPADGGTGSDPGAATGGSASGAAARTASASTGGTTDDRGTGTTTTGAPTVGVTTTTGTTSGTGGNDAVTPSLPADAGVALQALPSAREGCAATLTRKLGDLFPQPGTLPADARITYEIDAAPVLTGTAVLKIGYEQRGIRLALVDLEGVPAIIDTALARLHDGETIRVAKDQTCAPLTTASAAAATADTAAVLKITALTVYPDPSAGPAGADILELEEGRNGPALDVAYTYTAATTHPDEPARFGWSALFEAKVDDATLATLPAAIRWNLYDPATMSFLGEWRTETRDVLHVGGLSLADVPTLRRLLPRLAFVDLVFDAEPSGRRLKKRFILPLGALCRKYAQTVYADQTRPGCDCAEVTAADFP